MELNRKKNMQMLGVIRSHLWVKKISLQNTVRTLCIHFYINSERKTWKHTPKFSNNGVERPGLGAIEELELCFVTVGVFPSLSLYCCCCSVAKLCLTLCEPMDYSLRGSPILHHLLEFAQTHVHRVSDAIQPSHPLLPPSPPALNLSQHQSLVQ